MPTFYPGQTDYISQMNGIAAGGSTAVPSTFTPSLSGSTTAGTGTYTTRSGYATKTGNRVTFHLTIVCSAHTGTGPMTLTGLPYPASNNINAPVQAQVTDTVFSGSLPLAAVVANTSTITLPSMNMASALFAPTFTLLVSGTYMTDS